MGLWSRLRPSDSSLEATTEESRSEAEEARLQALISAHVTKSESPEVLALASSLKEQGRLNHFTELLTYSFTQRKA